MGRIDRPIPETSRSRFVLWVGWPGQRAPSALQEAERGLAVVFILLRAGTVLQILIGGLGWKGTPTAEIGYAMLTAAVVALSVTSAVATWRAGKVLPGYWSWLDVTTAVVALVGCAALVPASMVVGTWGSWGSGFAVSSAAAAGVWARTTRTVTAVCITIAALYVATAIQFGQSDLASIIGNAVGYPFFGWITLAFATYWRRLAASSDAATQRAIDIAERRQADQYRLMVHDVAGILRMLGDDMTPAVHLPPLRRQATKESRRLRAYLSDAFPGARSGPVPRPDPNITVGAVLSDVASGFTDLPLELLIDLGACTPLDYPVAQSLSGAVATILHNVRAHSEATEVFVHADCIEGTWEVVIADNGRGFDPTIDHLGFGLREQVIAAMARHHVAVSVRSSCGQGCSITLRGRAA